MVARVEPIAEANLERAVQLINKSNQYNLTTRRYSNADVLKTIGDPHWVSLTATLADKFGDHGLISVVLGKVDGTELFIDTWVMSCRVLKRTVECHLLNHLVGLARERGVRSIRGEFRPTPKNGLVQDHYARLGFTQIGAGSEGNTLWRLAVDDSWSPLRCFVNESGGPGPGQREVTCATIEKN
jgi:FkbH-like protein